MARPTCCRAGVYSSLTFPLAGRRTWQFSPGQSRGLSIGGHHSGSGTHGKTPDSLCGTVSPSLPTEHRFETTLLRASHVWVDRLRSSNLLQPFRLPHSYCFSLLASHHGRLLSPIPYSSTAHFLQVVRLAGWTRSSSVPAQQVTADAGVLSCLIID